MLTIPALRQRLSPGHVYLMATIWPYNPYVCLSSYQCCVLGLPLTPGGQSPNYIRMAEIMVEQWSQNLGITNVEIRAGTLDAWGQDAELVQIHRRSWGGLMPDPANFVRGFYDIFAAPNRGGEFIPDPEIEAMFAAVQTMAREDPAYCELVQEIERKILATGFLIPMIWDLWQYNVKPWVKGVESNMQLGWNTLLDVYIAEH